MMVVKAHRNDCQVKTFYICIWHRLKVVLLTGKVCKRHLKCLPLGSVLGQFYSWYVIIKYQLYDILIGLQGRFSYMHQRDVLMTFVWICCIIYMHVNILYFMKNSTKFGAKVKTFIENW